MIRKSDNAATRCRMGALCRRVGKISPGAGLLALSITASSPGEVTYWTDAHRILPIPLALTNTADGVQSVASVRATCGCVAVELEEGRKVDSGEILGFVATYRAPFSSDGDVEERVSVTLAPSGMTVEYPVRVRVRQRLGLEPPEASFGKVEPTEEGQELEVRLAGYAAAATTVLGTDGGRAFAVRVGEDGRSLRVRFAEMPSHPGLYAETWTVRTDDPELPVLKLPVRARVVEDTGENDFGAGRGHASGKLIEAGGEVR